MIEDAIKQFKPRFANDEDIRICNMLGKREKLIKSLKASGLEVARLEKAITRKTARQKDLESLEAQIERAIEHHLST